MATNPYEILGLPTTATEAEIKRKYYELAKKHHPDKLGHLSPEERAEHEEKFKKITAAYEYLREGGISTGEPDWASIWSRVEETFRNWAQTRARAAAAAAHEIYYDVPIEDIIINKERKIRIFLSGEKIPVYLKVRARDKGPIETVRNIRGTEHKIILKLRVKEHPDFWYDNILTPGGELYTSVIIQWHEYLCGCKRSITIPGLKEPRELDIPAFSRGPLEVKIDPDINLYIVLEIEPPSFEILTEEEKSGSSKTFEDLKKFLHEWSERALST